MRHTLDTRSARARDSPLSSEFSRPSFLLLPRVSSFAQLSSLSGRRQLLPCSSEQQHVVCGRPVTLEGGPRLPATGGAHLRATHLRTLRSYCRCTRRRTRAEYARLCVAHSAGAAESHGLLCRREAVTCHCCTAGRTAHTAAAVPATGDAGEWHRRRHQRAREVRTALDRRAGWCRSRASP